MCFLFQGNVEIKLQLCKGLDWEEAVGSYVYKVLKCFVRQRHNMAFTNPELAITGGYQLVSLLFKDHSLSQWHRLLIDQTALSGVQQNLESCFLMMYNLTSGTSELNSTLPGLR